MFRQSLKLRGWFKVGLYLTVFVVLSSPTLAVAPKEVPTKQTKKMAKIKKKMSVQKQAAKKLAQKEKHTAQELIKMRKKLIRATRELQGKQTEQHNLESRLNELEKETGLRGSVLRESRLRLAKMMSSLIQLSRKPPGMLLLHEESADAQVHRTILLRSMLPRLRQETASIMNEIDNFKELQKQTTTQKSVVAAARENLQRQRYDLDQLVKVRQGLLRKTKKEKRIIAQRLKRLANEAKDLRQLMERVTRPSWSKKIGSTPVVGKNLLAKNLKAGLKMPIAGKMIRSFGDKDEFGVISEGLVLTGPFGAPVIAPQSGRVVFMGPFRGYGKIVILQHSGGFYSFLSGFERIDTDMGQHVDAGEPLGILPLQGKAAPQIYFEWRKGTDPVNPIKKL